MSGFRRLLGLGVIAGLPALVGIAGGCGSDAKDAGSAGSGNPSAGSGNTGQSGSTSNPGGSGANPGAAGSVPATGSAADMARKLGRAPNFLIGMGNDLNNDHSQDGIYLLGPTLDLHYAYLVAYTNQDGSWGSWKDWNPDGSFVNVIADTSDAKGVAPMYTLYGMRAAGDGNLAGLTSDVYQKGYWADVKLLYQRIALFGKPAVVQLEPDFWGYAEQQSKEDPTNLKVHLAQGAPECADLAQDLAGMGKCLVRLARMYAPKALVGFHASPWAGSPDAMVTFLKRVGANEADVVFADMLDRDAGCYEVGTDPNCMRGGKVYWDETNATSPNFHEYLAWCKAMTTGLGRPMLWWQVPFGVPSTTPGGSEGKYRDNRVHYIFSHIQEFVDAGGLGVTFGVGAERQTTPDTDGGQFKAAVTAYYAAPVPLP